MSETNQILIYKTSKEHVSVNVRFQNETLWLNQSQIAQLFDTTKQNISLHLKNIYKEGELIEN